METLLMLVTDPRFSIVLTPLVVSIYSSLLLLDIFDREIYK